MIVLLYYMMICVTDTTINMKKYIFLDIDGVLATPECIEEGSREWGLVNRLQDIFERIINNTNAEIVLSSSWRSWDVEDTKQYMTEKGFRFSDRIIGVTIRAYQYLDRTKKIHLSIPRGVEIQQWIDTHIHSDNGKNFERKKIGIDYAYVIIDDEGDMLLHQAKHFVRTKSDVGITENDADHVISLLNMFDPQIADCEA